MAQLALRLVLGCAAAVAVLWAGAGVHLERACVLMDTLYLPLCSEQSVPSDQPGYSEPERLLARVRRNPGDSAAWTLLASAEPGQRHEVLLRAAMQLAPSDPNVMRLRAVQALTQNQWPLAISLLVPMSEHFGDVPAELLARLLATGQVTPLLRPYLVPGSNWFTHVLRNINAHKLPLEPVLPLLAEASARKIISSEIVLQQVRSLKAQGKWSDAYGLWISQQRQPAPLLSNASFDQRLQSDGFDWEITPAVPGRAGAVTSQRYQSGRGQVLEVQYTGRPVAIPVVRQYLFVPPGKYLLRGEYMTSRLRTEQGLAWAVRCPGSANVEAGRSKALLDSSGVWREFSFEFVVPPSCGLVASLQLETFASFEAVAGFKGVASFDAFELRAQAL